MKNDDYLVGLDIGSTNTVVVVGRFNEHNKIEIIGTGKSKSLGIKNGLIINIVIASKTIIKAINQAQNEAGIKISKALVGISARHMKNIYYTDYIIRDEEYHSQPISKKEIEVFYTRLKEYLTNRQKEIVEISSQRFSIDEKEDTENPIIGEYGKRIDVKFNVLIEQKLLIKNIKDCLQMADIRIQQIIPNPIALSDVILTTEEKEKGTALINIGGYTTELAVFKEGKLKHISVINMGGNYFTEDIKEAFCVIPKHAEDIKIKYGSVWPGETLENVYITIPKLLRREGDEKKEISIRRLSKIIHARVNILEGLIMSELKNYGYKKIDNKLNKGIVLTGGGSMLQHFSQLLMVLFDMNVKIGSQSKYITANTDTKLLDPNYSNAIGLLMQQKNKKEQQHIQHTQVDAKKTKNLISVF